MAEKQEYYHIVDVVSALDEVKSLADKKKQLTKEIRKIRRRLKSKQQEYSFLKTMIETSDANELELAVKSYFKKIGFSKVIHTGGDTNREDVQVWHGKKVYIIECRNKETKNASKDDVGQLRFRASLIKDFPEFKGHTLKYIMVMNNQHKFHPIKRDKNPLHSDVEKFLKSNKDGLVTTGELIRGFVKVMNKNMTFVEFNKKLNQIGLIEFKDKPMSARQN